VRRVRGGALFPEWDVSGHVFPGRIGLIARVYVTPASSTRWLGDTHTYWWEYMHSITANSQKNHDLHFIAMNIPGGLLLAAGTLASLYPLLLILRGPIRRWERRRRGLCINCGYNLTGNESGVCPECGTGVSHAGS
jgi:hypothetical protein